MLDKPKPVRDGLSNYSVVQQIIFKTHYLRKFRPLKIQDMCDGSVHLPVRASGFLPGTCEHPPAIGARNCCGASGERGEGERGRRRGREEREERRERKRGRNRERGVREHCTGTVVYPSYSLMLA